MCTYLLCRLLTVSGLQRYCTLQTFKLWNSVKHLMFSLLSRHMRGQVKLRVSNFRRIAFIRTQISRFTVDWLDVSRQQRKHVFITDTTVFWRNKSKASRKATYSYISNRYYYIIQTTYYVTNIYELKNIDAVVIYK